MSFILYQLAVPCVRFLHAGMDLSFDTGKVERRVEDQDRVVYMCVISVLPHRPKKKGGGVTEKGRKKEREEMKRSEGTYAICPLSS